MNDDGGELAVDDPVVLASLADMIRVGLERKAQREAREAAEDDDAQHIEHRVALPCQR